MKNTPLLENMGPPGLGSRDRAASSLSVNEIKFQKVFHLQTI